MIRKINYKSDFKLFLSGNFTSPFRLTIYTSGNRQGGYTVSFDGQSYQSCSVDGWGRLVVAVDNHNMGLGNLVYDIESFLTDSDFADGVCDVYATALPVVDAEGNFYVLTAQGETDVDFDATIPPFYQIGPQGPQGEPGPQGPQGETVPVVNDLTTGGADKALSAEMGKMLGMSVRDLEKRVHDLGDFPSTKAAEAKAAEEAISRNPSISIIHYSVNHTTSHIILQDVNDDLTQQVLYYGGHTYIRHIGANLNASWRKTNPTNIKYNQDSHRIALMHMVNQYGEGNNNIDWVELPTATTTKDGLMTKEQVVKLGELRQEIDAKAPKSGYAPNLKVNFAKELVGRGEATEQVIGGIRPTGEISIGDGNATIERIKGESVVWNQFANYKKISTVAFGLTVKGTEDGRVHISGTFTATKAVEMRISATNIIIPNGHKVIISTEKADKVKFRLQGGTSTYNSISTSDGTMYYDPVLWAHFTEGQEVDMYIRLSIHNLTLMFGAGNEPTTIEEFEARKPLNVSNDYNEGTIVSYNGDALKSVGFNAFTAENSEVGSISPSTGLNITSTSAKRSDFIPCVGNTVYEFITVNHMYEYDADRKFIRHFSLEDANFKPVTKRYTLTDKTRYIRVVYKQGDGSSVCVHLTHSGYRNGEYAPYEANTHLLPDVKSILDANGNKLFPHGLLSAGSVHDEITATKAIKRIGVVDMGSLAWKVDNDFGGYIALLETWRENNNTRMLLTSKYSYKYQTYNYSDDKVICAIYYHQIFVRDSSYTSIDEFKQALQGVPLYYELAEPIEVDLPEPLNMTYEAWDFGTEELIAKGATTPLNADIVYQFNAVDRIRENSSAIDVLEKNVDNLESLTLVTEDSLLPEVVTDYSLMSGDIVQTSGTSENKIMSQKAVTEYIEELRKLAISPSGDPMHNLYISAGAEYNATGADTTKTAPWGESVTHKAGHWYLNGLGDLNNEDMCNIIEVGRIKEVVAGLYTANTKVKTNLPLLVTTQSGTARGLDLRGMFSSATELKVILLSTYANSKVPNGVLGESATTAQGLQYTFSNCRKLNIIATILDANNITSFTKTFTQCSQLKTCYIKSLKASVSFADSPNFSAESIHYIIQKAIGGTASAPITITLHATVKANWEASAYYTEDLTKANELNITIA